VYASTHGYDFELAPVPTGTGAFFLSKGSASLSSKTKKPPPWAALLLLRLGVERGLRVHHFLYQSLDPIQGRCIGDPRRYLPIMFNLEIKFSALFAHGSPL
jgi:hypothetical protein